MNHKKYDNPYEDVFRWEHTFSDRCVTIEEGEELEIVNDLYRDRRVTIIGYFYDVE